jgi:hypothetical protein
MEVMQDLHPGSTEAKAVTLRGTVQTAIVIVEGTRTGTKVGRAVITETVITVARAIQIGILIDEAVIGETGTLTEMDVRAPTEAGAGVGVRAVAEPTATAIALAHLVKHQSRPTWQS